MKRAAIMQKVHPLSFSRVEQSSPEEGAIACDIPSLEDHDEAQEEKLNPQNHQELASAKKSRAKPKKRKAMLTSAQLSDLFTRLDKNGDGVLDLDEFIGLIRLLKVDVSEDYVASVFHQVDQAGGNSELTGTLDMQEFIAAYQKIYCGTKTGDANGKSAQNESFIRATRYGRMLNGQYVFECYTLSSSGGGVKYTLDLTSQAEVSDSEDDEDSEDEGPKIQTEPLPKNFWDAASEPFEGTMEDIIKLIRQDSSRNKTLHSNVLWWIDAAYDSVNRSTAEEIVTAFGLPNDSKFLSDFGNFGNAMSGDTKSRLFAGTGNHTSGMMCSLSCFVQALWIKGVPVVHHLPPWFRLWRRDNVQSGGFLSGLVHGVVEYYKTRFAWLLNLSWINTHDHEERLAYQRAEGLATVSVYTQL